MTATDNADIIRDLSGRMREQLGFDERQALRASALAVAVLGGDPRHIIELRRDGWTLKHPLACRLTELFDCPTNRAAISGLHRAPEEPGRYYIDLLEGVLVIGEAVHD
jgi:hypothetical protein